MEKVGNVAQAVKRKSTAIPRIATNGSNGRHSPSSRLGSGTANTIGRTMPPAQSQRRSALSPAVNITRKAVAAIKLASNRQPSTPVAAVDAQGMLASVTARVMVWPGW